MKPIKILGLAALAALMAMAFIGASSAMAEGTGLCSNDAESCTAVTHVHETSVSKAKLLTTFLTIECDVLFLGDAAPAHDSSAAVVEGNFTYTNCGSCTATEENGPAEIKVLKLGHETSDVTGEGLVHVVCGESLDCAYNGVGLKGTGKGPLLSTQKNGEVTLTKVTTNKEAGGFLCPSESKLDLTTTPLSATYIAPWLGYCVQTEHTNGLYTDSNCKTLGSEPPKHKYTYTLVWAPVNWGKVGETRCYDTLSHEALYKDFSNLSSPCSKESDQKELKWLYENGTITVVE